MEVIKKLDERTRGESHKKPPIEKDWDLVSIKTVAARFEVCQRSIYRWMQVDHEFPKPIRFGGSMRFRDAEISEYVWKKIGGLN